MYGQGAKYNTMEHRFRAWRKTAENLRVTAGEGNPQSQPQTTPKTPRTPTPGEKKAGSRSKRKTDKATKTAEADDFADSKAAEQNIDIVEISGDETSPIKPEIKQENEMTRSLMGIKSYPASDSDADDDDVQGMDEHVTKRLKTELDMDDVPAQLPVIDLEREVRIDSKSNGYDLSLPSMAVTAPDAHENVLANLDTLVRGSVAYDSVFGSEA